jgi:hypothetical protein
VVFKLNVLIGAAELACLKNSNASVSKWKFNKLY